MADSSPMFYTSGGSMRVTVVDGTALTGIMAADGSFNVVINDGTELTGIYHPCGAIQVVVATEAVTGIYHPCGALYVSDENDYYAGSVRCSGLGAIITLSDTTIAEDASVGDLLGTLSVTNGSGVYAFTITLNDYFEIDGVDDTRVEVKASLDYETNPTHSITIQADNGVDDPLERTFTITVTDVSEGGGGEALPYFVIIFR
jgi:hypothetical protein